MKMKMFRRTAVVAMAALVLTLSSCATVDTASLGQIQDNSQSIEDLQSQIIELQGQVAELQGRIDSIESVEEPEAEIQEEHTIAQNQEEVTEIIDTTDFWTIGTPGPTGNLIFQCNGIFLEMGEPLYEAPSYEEALSYCQKMEYAFRLPSVDELLAIYHQLVETEISDIDWTYYWSCETVSEESAKVVNFDTGFEGTFYKSMDFVGAIPVREI